MKTIKYFKKSNFVKLLYLTVLFAFVLGCTDVIPPARNIELHPIFTNNMVLQQKQDVPIWGTAEPGGEVIVELDGKEEKVTVDKNGKWQVNLPSIQAGGPYELVIRGEKTRVIKNVLVGEVWICSGQSNMEMAVSASWGIINNDKEEITNANYPEIRLFMVDKKMAETPQENLESEGWKECSPESVPVFSAVAYFFGRHLQSELNVPVGLIETAWGGTLVEAWTSGKTLKQFPEFTDLLENLTIDTSTDEEKVAAIKKKMNEWPDEIEKILKDKGIFDHGFQNSDYNTNKWKTMELPTTWEQTGLEYDGVVWFSKNVNIPKTWKGQDLTLSLGKINDYDITWFNGEKIGRGTDVSKLREYKIPSSLVKVGENKIVVHVLDIGNNGGIYGPAKKMNLSGSNDTISLVGNWKYEIDPIKISVRKLPEKPTVNTGANRPTVLYNAMINPIIPYGIKGAIWYQGESNAERAYQYRTLFKSFINDWRREWNIGDFPFLFVQLANFKEVQEQPGDDSWAELREAQTMALDLPNTGMAVTIDIGDAKDIHPKNKQDVGKRLALNALAKVYKKDIPYSGPMYSSMNVEGNKINLKFTNTNGGLKAGGNDELKGFAIAGEDKKFVWAKAEIRGDEIIVWNNNVKKPVAVRYAWASNPICNLYNGAGLPASPFRTDDWKGKTYGKK